MNAINRKMAAALLAMGLLFAGPCGITTLQLQDFVTSTIIRTGVSTFFSVFEAATINPEQA